jgi:hypothetical protein
MVTAAIFLWLIGLQPAMSQTAEIYTVLTCTQERANPRDSSCTIMRGVPIFRSFEDCKLYASLLQKGDDQDSYRWTVTRTHECVHKTIPTWQR